MMPHLIWGNSIRTCWPRYAQWRQKVRPPGLRKAPPGMLGRREVGEGVFVLTGQDLGPAQDPRWGYRRLYYELSAMLPQLAPGHDYDD